MNKIMIGISKGFMTKKKDAYKFIVNTLLLFNCIDDYQSREISSESVNASLATSSTAVTLVLPVLV